MRDIPTDRLSLVVGVTGHRDVAEADEAPLRAAFGSVLRELAAACPHTPLLVLSGLAAGADALAAQEAIAQQIPVMACLPMPIAEYEQDFSPSELVRFRSLLAACSRVIITSREREGGYVIAGLFIAQYSHVLVAFWDGADSRGEGGTADVVRMRMTGESQRSENETSVPYLPDLGPVYHIVTPRASSTRPTDAYHIKRLYPKRFHYDVNAERDFSAILSRIDLYNVDIAHSPPAPREGDLQALMDRTDAAANRLQKRTNLFQMILYVCAFLAATIQILSSFPPIVKVLGLAAAFVAYRLARKNDYENRYQDYRALAEGLRVQYAWFWAGLSYKLADNAYLRMQESELQWIRMALRAFYLVTCEDRERSDASHAHPACRAWVRSQWVYYRRASRRETVRKHGLERITILALWIGVTLTIVCTALLLPVWTRFGAFPVESGWPKDLLTVLLTTPLAMAALLAALLVQYIDKQNFTANARRYERMFQVFDKARRRLIAIGKGQPGNPQEIIFELGREALIEHADWLIMRRDRPIEMVLV